MAVIRPSGFLNASERIELTARKTRRGQRRWLTENGIKHFVRADGWPAVLWDAVSSRLGIQSTRTEQPNFKALQDGKAA